MKIIEIEFFLEYSNIDNSTVSIVDKKKQFYFLLPFL